MPRANHVVLILSLCLVTPLVGCGGDDGTGPSGPASIQVTASSTTVVIGQTVQLTARVRDAGGSVLEGQSPTWSSSNPDAVIVDASGIATGVAPGIARIDAKVGDVTGSLSLTARAPDCSPLLAGGSIETGAEVEGVLDLNDCFFPDGPHSDGFAFEITETTIVEVELASTAFDAVLVVTDLDMEILEVNDDAGFTTDSRIVALLEPGEYVLWVLSFDGALGSYDLTFDTGLRELCSEPVGTLGLGDSVDGELGAETCLSTLAGVADPYLFETAGPVTIRVTLTSDDFDAFLGIVDADGNVLATDDDGAGGLNSRLEIALTAGSYTVWASSWVGVEYGSYAMSLAEAAAAGTAHAGAGAGWPRPSDRGSKAARGGAKQGVR